MTTSAVAQEEAAERFAASVEGLARFTSSLPLRSEQLDVLVAGISTRFTCHGSGLADAKLSALRHLPTTTHPPQVSLTATSSESVGANLPRPDLPEVRVTVRGDLPDLVSERYSIAFSPSARQLSLVDRSTGQGFEICESSSLLRSFERAAPWRIPLYWLLRDRERLIVHAAAIGSTDGAVLLVGSGGAGKSTAALRALEEGWGFLGDDLVVVSTDGSDRVFSLYNSSKLVPGGAVHLPSGTRQRHWEESEGKHIHLLKDAYRDQLITEAPIRAVLLVDRRDPGPGLQPIPAVRAVSVVASTTYRLFPGAGTELLHGLSDIASRVPVLRFCPGPPGGLDLLRALVGSRPEK